MADKNKHSADSANLLDCCKLTLLDPTSDIQKELLRHNVQTLAQYLWVVRGCRAGEDERNWFDVENRLKRCLFDDRVEKIILNAPRERIDSLLTAIEGKSDAQSCPERN
jgi:hypothetical protein